MHHTICLWFDNQAEEAAKFYVSIFKNSALGATALYPEGSPGEAGTVMTVTFTLNGLEFMALNGGPIFTFNEAVSIVVNCDTQEEIDALWEKLSAHPENEQCGWLKDKYGVSWQIVPKGMDEMMASDKDPEKAKRAMHAMLQMKKIDWPAIQKAYDGE